MKLKENQDVGEKRRGLSRQTLRHTRAFTLLEVMIAMFVFFTATFAILSLTSQNLRSARMLKQHGPSIGKIAGEIMMTNKLEEGVESGNFSDDGYRNYDWTREITLFGTNGLFRVDIVVVHNGAVESSVSFIRFAPDSQPSPFGAKKFQ